MTDRITSASLLELVRRARKAAADKADAHNSSAPMGVDDLHPESTLYWQLADAIESLTGEGDLGEPRASALEVTDEMVEAAVRSYHDFGPEVKLEPGSATWTHMRRALNSALQASEAQRPSIPSPSLGWQPIATAPKDGRCILLLSDNDEPACYIGKWNPAGDSWTDESGGFVNEICRLTVTGVWDSQGGWFQPNEVSHWAPLPLPPSSDEVAAPIPSPSEEELREVLARELERHRYTEVAKILRSGNEQLFGPFEKLALKAMRTISQTTRTETELEAASNGMGLR